MTDISKAAFAAVQWIATSSASNATATATQAAPGVNQKHLIYGWTFSCRNGAPTSITVTVQDGAGVILDQVEIPASSSAMPIRVNYTHALMCTAGSSAQIIAPAMGGSVVGTVVLHGGITGR